MLTGRKLLLADDSVTIQKVIDLTFTDEGIEVTTVGNGEQAISKLEEIQPDIVLADIFMPGRSGYEVCEHIKRDERFRHIPVMLLVGSFEPFDEAEARRVGADDYLTKPFQSIRQLVNKVTALLSGGGGEAEDKVGTRDLELPKKSDEKEQGRADAGGADIHTADTAPLPKELEDKEPAEVAAHLAGHESLDDEMIEARPMNAVEEPRETIGATDARATAPFSPADLKEAGLETSAQASPELLQETMRDFKLNDDMNEEAPSTEETQKRVQPQARYMNDAAAADEALLDLGDIDLPMSTSEADDFILDLQDDEPLKPFQQPSQASAAPANAAQQPEVEAASVHGSFDFAQAVASAPGREFGEDIVPAAPESAEASAPYAAEEEATATEAQMAEETAGIESFASQEAASPEVFDPQVVSHGLTQGSSLAMQETMLSEEAPAGSDDAERTASDERQAQTAPRAGQITLDQLSPEAIDAIARRAVELLSTKVVEEIAWEVVPQLAELLIKRKLEEEKT